MKNFLTFLFAFVIFPILFVVFTRAKDDVVSGIQGRTQLKPKKEKVDFSKMTKQQWVNYWMKKLTLEQKVAQMVMPDARGIFIARNNKEFKRLVHYVKDRKVGGLIFFRGDVFETSDIFFF